MNKHVVGFFMIIIPVIDVLGGRAVHAVAGQRQLYQPLKTSLSGSDSPESIVQSLIDLFPCDTIYLADLDAIEKRGNNHALITALHDTFQSLTLWIDRGSANTRHTHTPRIVPVIGSETLITPDGLRAIVATHPDSILSLDFTGKTLRGDPRLLENTDAWPRRIMIMNLAHVGMHRGPDYALIGELLSIAGDRCIFVAGGVRDASDLRRLETMGIDGVLIATALHTGTINGATITTFSR